MRPTRSGWLSAALNRILKYTRDGVLQYYWGAMEELAAGSRADCHCRTRWMWIRTATSHIASWDGGWANKFVAKPGADPSKLGAPRAGSEGIVV